MKWLPILFVLFAFSALAADISGNGKATAVGPSGTMERTFPFKKDVKVEGDIVAVTISAKIGEEASRTLLYIPIAQDTDGSEEIL